MSSAKAADARLRASSSPRDVELRDVIAVQVQNFSTLRAQLECANRDGRRRNIVLYLDDRPLDSLVAYPPTDPDLSVLMFTLRRTETSREVWTHILGKPGFGARETKVSVGIDDRFAIPSEAFLRFHVLPWFWLILWFVLLGACLYLFFRLARRTDLLRDRVDRPWSGPTPPYSLASVQASLWFFVILASYVFIGLVTGDFSTSITGTVLVLLGVSAATKVGGALVEERMSTPERVVKEAVAIQDLEKKMEEIRARLEAIQKGLDKDPNDGGARRAKAAEMALQKRTSSQLRKLLNVSENFGIDILSDANGVNFHRFQMVAWTVVLSLVFGTQVYRELAMPQFSETLLGLMGISAGTYVGLKATEATVPTST